MKIMGKKINMLGKRFGRLIVIKENSKGSNGGLRYWCKCDCGNEKEINGYSLRIGETQSCGCLNREIISKPNKVRGTKLYGIYMGIKRRCYNLNAKEYKNYGGRGIKMCNEWYNDYHQNQIHFHLNQLRK